MNHFLSVCWPFQQQEEFITECAVLINEFIMVNWHNKYQDQISNGNEFACFLNYSFSHVGIPTLRDRNFASNYRFLNCFLKKHHCFRRSIISKNVLIIEADS